MKPRHLTIFIYTHFTVWMANLAQIQYICVVLHHSLLHKQIFVWEVCIRHALLFISDTIIIVHKQFWHTIGIHAQLAMFVVIPYYSYLTIDIQLLVTTICYRFSQGNECICGGRIMPYKSLEIPIKHKYIAIFSHYYIMSQPTHRVCYAAMYYS